MKRVYYLGDNVPSVVRLQEGERLSVSFVAPRGVSGEFDVCFELCGKGAELELAGVYMCDETQRVKFRIQVRHLVGNTRSNQLFKGIVNGTSKADFDALVYIAHGAEKVEALQENHTLLLSQSAQVQTSPQLEIYADDVKCSHGATVGSLDQMQLYYMLSRGIDEATAKQLQILSFLSPVLTELSEEQKEKLFK